MKRYELKLPDGRSVEVGVGGDDVEIDGEAIRVGGAPFRGGAAILEGERLLVSHPLFQGECELREKSRRGGGADRLHGAEATDLRAPFPGKVVKILVSAPIEVAKGEPLVVLEAMKMEFTYTAPSDLRIAKVLVREGEVLEKGAPFFEY